MPTSSTGRRVEVDDLAPRDRPWALWLLQARINQLPPVGDWLIWLLLAGRGYGKGKSASNWLGRKASRAVAGSEWVVLAPTYQLVRRVCVEGPSGLLAALGGEHGPLVDNWNRSMGELRLANGATIFAVSADEPDRLRGMNLSGGWVDELCSMERGDELWNEALIPALRVGDPRLVVSTTPRPQPLLKSLVARTDGSVVVVRGSTWENADNLAPAFLDELRARYAGTRLGRQELEAEILEDVEGALWERPWILHAREAPDLDRVVVAIDPATTSNPDSDQTGIIGAGVAGHGSGSHGWVLADRSCIASPGDWGRRGCLLAIELAADAFVYEVNQGGEMVEHVIRSAWAQLQREGVATGPMPRCIGVRATRGKAVRAEPVAAQYEQGRWHHLANDAVDLGELEDQLCGWVPGVGPSPDRLDALVWAAHELTVTDFTDVAVSGLGAVSRARVPSTSTSTLVGGRRTSPAGMGRRATFGR